MHIKIVLMLKIIWMSTPFISEKTWKLLNAQRAVLPTFVLPNTPCFDWSIVSDRFSQNNCLILFFLSRRYETRDFPFFTPSLDPEVQIQSKRECYTRFPRLSDTRYFISSFFGISIDIGE